MAANLQKTFYELGHHFFRSCEVIKWKHFPVTVPLWGECTGHRWIPLTKTSDAELWCFLWSAPERLCKHSRRRWIETPSRSLWCYCNVKGYHMRSLKPLPKLMLTTKTLEKTLKQNTKKCKYSSAKCRPFCSQCVMKLGYEVGIAAQDKSMECHRNAEGYPFPLYYKSDNTYDQII